MTTIARVLLRLPVDVWEELKEWADEEHRSLNAHLVYVLRRALKEWRD